MAKKKSHVVRNSIIAVTLGALGAAVAGILSNKKTRTAVVKEVKKVEKTVVAKAKKKR
jgi:hypothetical protein